MCISYKHGIVLKIVPVHNAHGGLVLPCVIARVRASGVNMHGRMNWHFLGCASAILNSYDGDDAAVIASGVAWLGSVTKLEPDKDQGAGQRRACRRYLLLVVDLCLSRREHLS